jgi:hypothetical protein
MEADLVLPNLASLLGKTGGGAKLIGVWQFFLLEWIYYAILTGITVRSGR